MTEFRTKYDPFPRKIRILDSTDNVDRLSYLAPADLIRRFMSSGEDYLRNRKVAFAQGLYGQEEDLSGVDYAAALPVYPQDIVDLEKQTENSRVILNESIKKYQDNLKELENAKKNFQPSESSSEKDEKTASFGSEN